MIIKKIFSSIPATPARPPPDWLWPPPWAPGGLRATHSDCEAFRSSDTSASLSPTELNCGARTAGGERETERSGEKDERLSDLLSWLSDRRGCPSNSQMYFPTPTWAFYVFAWLFMLFSVRIFPVKMKINQPKQSPASQASQADDGVANCQIL